MLMETIFRAKTIFKRKEVLICEDKCSPPNFYQFVVKQRSGVWTDVWYKNVNGHMEWSCNAVDVQEGFGCVFVNDIDKTQAYCSHTLACKLLLNNLNKK